MPKDATKNVDRYKVRGGELNEFDFHQNQEAYADQQPKGQPANLIPGTPPEARKATKTTTKRSKATKGTKSTKERKPGTKRAKKPAARKAATKKAATKKAGTKKAATKKKTAKKK
ncbi:MAG TPA: hypothetical protein VFP64_14235 [Pyrinomonadaceae bacterium]|nr:hypothetical protein [Pyrinomonadaceae bacterium]